jgi:hypothetical protein
MKSDLHSIEVGHLRFYVLVNPASEADRLLAQAQVGWGWEPEGVSGPLAFPEKLRLSPSVGVADLRSFGQMILRIADEMQKQNEADVLEWGPTK